MIVDHAEYILGESVDQLETHTPAGPVPVRPSWHLLMFYETKIRERALEMVREDDKLANGLRTV